MPIRMVDDPQNSQEQFDEDNYDRNTQNAGSGGGGLGGAMVFLPILFKLFKGGGKKIIWLLIIGALLYFGYNAFKKFSNSKTTSQNDFSKTGYKYDEAEYKKQSVYEGLTNDNSRNPLPESVSLLRFAPARQDQGEQGSCVAWSSSYAASSILQASSNNQAFAFSPAFMYNNIKLGNDCQGAYLPNAMKFLQEYGSVPFTNFPYDPNSCTRKPGQDIVNIGQQFKIHGYQRLTETADPNTINVRAIKEHLNRNAPVCIGMMVGGSFMQPMGGQKVWHPTPNDRDQTGFGGHAMCVIGYDDRIEGGAFEIMNSWGNTWGVNGIAFVRYPDFKEFVREAYGIDPLPLKGAALTKSFDVTVGLVNNETKQNIALKNTSAQFFTTVNKVAQNTTFKIAVKNNVECYVYLFGEEVDGKSYVLFPYKKEHSPYFGVTGYRLFPRAQSLKVDEIGTQDRFAIVTTKKPIDYEVLNQKINAGSGTYLQKINAALASSIVPGVKYSTTPDGSLLFSAGLITEDKVVTAVVEMSK